ncbi:hypothetical protein Sjap_021215 [Stephania japonica]|uniref:Uncharacterized protein n=1 Tax=Stephania japonica TaxID=461633 RepID=A0AAP0F3E1_9MAGN
MERFPVREVASTTIISGKRGGGVREREEERTRGERKRKSRVRERVREREKDSRERERRGNIPPVSSDCSGLVVDSEAPERRGRRMAMRV